MLIKLSESSDEYRQILGGKSIKDYMVYNDSNQMIGRVADALLDDSKFRFLIVNLANESSVKTVLIPWEGQGVDPDRNRISVGKITAIEAANLPDYNPPKSRQQEIDAQIVQLLQERVVVDAKRRKVGEVIVRKEVETRMLQVPVRREKLIVEQVSPERKELVSLDLGITANETIKFVEGLNVNPSVSCEFSTPQAAIEFLQSLSADSSSNIQRIRIDCISS